MNFIEQWREKWKFEKIVKELDVSEGLPSDLKPAPGSDLEAYLHQLNRVDLGLKETLPQPQKVYYGEVRGLQHAVLGRTRRDTPPQFPPRTTYQAELPIVLTTQVKPTLEHITRLTAFNLNIDPKDQGALVTQTINSLKEDRRSSFTDFGDNWTLRLVVERSSGDNSYITPRLIPEPKNEYSHDWIKRKTKNLKKAINPENLSEQVDKAAGKNFCVRDVTLTEIDPFDLGGNSQVNKIIYDAGYLEVKDTEAPENILARIMGVIAFRHQDDIDGKTPLLGRKIDAGYETIRFSAIVPSGLSAEFHSEFQKRFQKAAERIVKNRIKEGLKRDENIDLNPDEVTTETLHKLDHRIVSDDYHDQLDWLCRIALDTTLNGISQYPKTRTASKLLVEAGKLAVAAQKIDNVLAENAGERDIQFTLGWSPDAVSMVFPAAWFAKE